MRVAEIARSLLGVDRPAVEAREVHQSTAQVGQSRRSNGTVTYDRALAHGAVYACVDLLVRLVAWQMPVGVQRDGRPVLSPTIIANPHPEVQMLAQHWYAQIIESTMMRGYAAGLVTSIERNGDVRQIMPIHPDEVRWTRRNGQIRWTVAGKPAELLQLGGELWVAPGPRVAPGCPVGTSVLAYAREQVALGLEAGQFGRDYFIAGGMPVMHVTIDEAEVESDAADDAKARYLAATVGRSPLVTGNKVSLTPIPVTAEDSQFLETVTANVAMVCMFFGIPPESIGGSSGDSMTYANVEGRNLSLLTNTVGAWMVWLEATMTQLMNSQQRAVLDPEALLRTSIPTLYATATQAAGRGGPAILTVNEARAIVGYEPHPDGDTLYVPSSVIPTAVEPGGGTQP